MESPERKLWNAVLLLFLKDAQDLIDKIDAAESTIKYFKSRKLADENAKKFIKVRIEIQERRLHKSNRRWQWLNLWVRSEDFTEKCYMAGQDPDAFREKAIKVLDGELVVDKLALSKHNWNDLKKPQQ